MSVPYTKQVAYIESTGTQYIDTGFKPNQDTRVICSFEQITTRSIAAPFGCESPRYSAYIISSKFRFDYNSTMTSTQIQVENNVRHEIDFNKNNVYLDGALNTTFTYGNFTAPNLLLFRTTYGSSNFYGRIYWCKVYDNDVLVRDFIPVRVNEVGYFYDKVSGELFNNAGSGYFVFGDDVINHDGFLPLRRRLLYAKPKEVPNYLCFTALEDGEFTYRISLNTGLSLFSYIEYSVDEGTTWVKADNVENEVVSISTPTIPAGGKVYWRGEGESCSARLGSDLYSYFSSTGKFNVSGNVFSLLLEKFDENSTRGQFNVFNSLFQNCKVVDASELILGNVSGGFNTYQAFFKNCIYLTGAPTLQSDNLRPSQFIEMFRGCTSLTTAPKLLSTTLSQYCYQRMFYGCTSLVNVQSTLPALAMTNGCYQSMFEECSSLINVPDIQATTLADYCFYNMFRNCTSVTTTIDFDKWATLYNSCFRGMYDGCTGLTTIKSLPSNIDLPTGCFIETFRYCSSLVSAPDWYVGSFLGESISGMFRGCTSLIHCPIKSLPTTLVGRCCLWLFTGCTSLLDVCDLPAEILPVSCYNSMLQNTKITYIKMLATDISASQCLQNWVSGVPSSGIFVKHIDAQWTTTGNSGVPTNWTVIYYDPAVDKYYLDQQRSQECDDHGNPI